MVLRHARDDEDAVELLNMLGLGAGQADSMAPRGCSGRAGRRSGAVHALSAGTEARLALNPAKPPATTAPRPMPAQAPAEVPAAPRTPARADADRRCEECRAPVVTQTRYRLDPAGYRARGVRLFAAKGRCHPCYYRRRRPAAADVAEPQNPRRCGQCGRSMVSTRVFSADPDGWRERGWVAHAAHGVCRPCRSAAEEPGRRAARRAARQAPVLGQLIDQLIALRQQVGFLRHSYPDDEHLAGVSATLAQARKHLDNASVRITEGSVGTSDQGGGVS